MTSAIENGYGLGDEFPINPIDPGRSLFIAGPALSPADDLARSLVAHGPKIGDGALLISTNKTSKKIASDCRRSYPTLDPSRFGVIDCSGHDIGNFDLDVTVKYVSTQSDLTGIGMNFSALYESLYHDARDGRVRTGLINLSSLSMFVDMRTLFQFVQTLSGRIDSADGLGVFAIDPTTHDTKTVNTLSQAVDGRIDVRNPKEHDDVDGELRVRGLRNQPDGWQPFTLP